MKKQKLLAPGVPHPTKRGGTLTITGPRDRDDRCQFVIEWEDKVPHCSKCGCRPGEGYPVPCSDGPICGSHKSRGASPPVVCDGEMTKRRGQFFFAVPEQHL